ncbi:MAG: hypothetical protein PHF84_03305 [bacterium]|nr:hypothetical protein [bacterium]
MMKPRKRSLLVTVLNLVFIFFIMIFINTYILNVKTLKKDGLKIKFKIDNLKDDLGFILSFSVFNDSDREQEVRFGSGINFFIREKKGTERLWQKLVQKPNFPMVLDRTNSVYLLKEKNDMVNFLYIYEYQNNILLKPDEYSFGAEALVGTNRILMTIPISTKPKKGIEKLFK